MPGDTKHHTDTQNPTRIPHGHTRGCTDRHMYGHTLTETGVEYMEPHTQTLPQTRPHVDMQPTYGRRTHVTALSSFWRCWAWAQGPAPHGPTAPRRSLPGPRARPPPRPARSLLRPPFPGPGPLNSSLRPPTPAPLDPPSRRAPSVWGLGQAQFCWLLTPFYVTIWEERPYPWPCGQVWLFELLCLAGGHRTPALRPGRGPHIPAAVVTTRSVCACVTAPPAPRPSGCPCPLPPTAAPRPGCGQSASLVSEAERGV